MVKLRNWFVKVQGHDVFMAPAQGAATQALDACERALEPYAARVYAEEADGN